MDRQRQARGDAQRQCKRQLVEFADAVLGSPRYYGDHADPPTSCHNGPYRAARLTWVEMIGSAGLHALCVAGAHPAVASRVRRPRFLRQISHSATAILIPHASPISSASVIASGTPNSSI